MFEESADIDFVIPILMRNGLELYLQKCENKLLEAERAFARKNPENARNFKHQFEKMIKAVESVNFNVSLLSELSKKTENLKNRINKLNIG